MVDTLQRRVFARSVSSLATQLGLQHWLVDLRHEATHATLPSIAVCRLAYSEVGGVQLNSVSLWGLSGGLDC